jgi:iron complex outermembrane receptor protein
LFVPTLVGNPAVGSEVQWAYEIGYRAQLAKRVNVDIAAYYNDYAKLISFDDVQRVIPGVPVGIAEIPWANNLSGNTHGAEIAVNVSPRDAWRLTASYALFIARFRGPASADPVGMQRNSPEYQAMVRSSSDLTKRASLDVQFRYIHDVAGVSAYYTADMRFAYRLTDQLELSVTGKNLLDRRHPEQPSIAFGVVSEVPRAVTGKITWRF